MLLLVQKKHEITLNGKYDAPSEKGEGNKLKLVYSNNSACRKLLVQ